MTKNTTDELQGVDVHGMNWIDELLQNTICASHLLEQDGCLYCDEVKLKQTIATKLLEAELKGFDVAFDCHDYDRLRAYKAKLTAQLNTTKEQL